MINLRIGDHLPTVATVQILLNARRNNHIVVDGDFGSITYNAVKDFQRMTGCSSVSGRVDPATWNRLNLGMNLATEDIIDITDPLLLKDLDELQRLKCSTIAVGGMSNAVEQVINLIVNKIPNGSLLVLRFNGHGNHGRQVVGAGRGWVDMFGTPMPIDPRKIKPWEATAIQQIKDYSLISYRGLKYIKNYLIRLKPCFSPYGSIEFHGCSIAGGADGKPFLKAVSQIVGVPAVGAAAKQYVGHVGRFDGMTFTGCPNDLTLKDWAANLPKLNKSLP
jgi:Putative peptidoglycan binding domain